MTDLQAAYSKYLVAVPASKTSRRIRVLQLWPTIAAALADQLTISEIYRVLQADTPPLGMSYTTFRRRVRAIQAKKAAAPPSPSKSVQVTSDPPRRKTIDEIHAERAAMTPEERQKDFEKLIGVPLLR